MQLRTTDNPRRGRFELYADDELVGHVTYAVRDGVMSVPHTEVQPRHRGRGLASAMIKHVLDTARSRGLAVLPLCPFTARYIANHREYLPLVPAGQRARFDLEDLEDLEELDEPDDVDRAARATGAAAE
ncbi:MAG TPA: GNAT family N-acetyltransferase [Pseudonocardiaceae bacterium]